MPSPNRKNPRKGRDFERKTGLALQTKFKCKFFGKKIPVGNPPKLHEFDLVSDDESIIVECKNYSYTKTGNIPSAKMAFINEAVLYLHLSHVPKNAKKIIVLRKAHHPKRKKSLAEYYKKTYKHLLKGVVVMELDLHKMVLVEK